MAGLLVNNFWRLNAKLPFRFVAEFAINGVNLQFTVKNVKLPKYEINTDGNVYLGNTNIICPTYNVSTRKIDFTLEETDDFSVTKAIHWLIQRSYGRQHYRIPIHLKQFDEHFQKIIWDKGYLCHLASYDEPSMKRDGSAAPIDINVSFILDFEGTWDDVNSNGGYYNILKDNDTNSNIKKLNIKEKNYKFEYTKKPKPDLSFITPAITDKPAKTPYNNGIGINTCDFNITDNEINNALSKIHTDSPGGKNVTFEQLKKVQQYNADKMHNAYDILQTSLNSMGISISVNAYNDTEHGVGLGTNGGSHLLGQKVDLTFTDSNGNKITSYNLTKEQKKKIEDAAKAAGLIPNYESDQTKNGKDSFWGDFTLANAMSIDASGNTVMNKQMSKWSNGKMFRVDKKDYVDIGI